MWSYDDLSIFLKVIKEGNFANAAKKLGVPASTVSRRISKLEESLGIKLIKRNTRKFQATKIGLELFELCTPQIDSLESHLRGITATSNEISGKLTITAPIFLVQELLQDWFIEFQVLYPKVELSVHTDNKMKDLITEEVELAIRIGPLEDSTLIAQRLWDTKIIAYANREYIENNPSVSAPSDIYNHSALFFRNARETWVFQHCKTGDVTTIKPKPRLYTNDIRTIIQATQAGLGIACLPKFAVDKLPSQTSDKNTLMPLLMDYAVLPERSVYVVYQDRKFLSRNARALLEFIQTKFQRLSEQEQDCKHTTATTS